MKPYKYHPLEHGDFTRILLLHPATDHAAPLRCDLKHCQEQTFSCEAVSYAWGTPIFTGTLFCDSDDEHIQIASSLDALLRALRKPSGTRKLWVDAVCINQEDTDEKSRQVRAMSEIYRRARQVIAWVGEDYDDASKVLLFFTKNIEEFWRVDSMIGGFERAIYLDSDPGAIETLEKSICETFGRRDLAAIRKIFLRPWFKRRWIIQEVALAAKPIIRCGSTTMGFFDFALCANIINLFYEQREGHVFDPRCMMDDHITSILQSLAAHQDSRFPILELLHTYHAAQCSDDRDRIYALLGLSDDLVSKPDVDHAHKRRRRYTTEIPINYEDGAEQVYTTLAL
ncbi:HET-domain-containing protein, partial [Trematosphaeria pertusa]